MFKKRLFILLTYSLMFTAFAKQINNSNDLLVRAHSSKPSQIMLKELQQWIDPSEPGCSAAYGKEDEIYYESIGVEDLIKRKKISENTPFLTASISKQFTAHTALKLAQAKQLDLDKNITDYLSTFIKKYPVSTSQLMEHTSGLLDHWPIFELQGKLLSDTYTQQQAFDIAIQNDFLQFQPGTRFSYSNGGYLVLTQLIETVQQQSLNTVMQTLFLDDLGINAHFFTEQTEHELKYAQGYIKKRIKKLHETSGERSKSAVDYAFEPVTSHSTIYGPGNLVINTQNFAKWAEYLTEQLTTNPYYIEALANPEKHNNYFAGLYIDDDFQSNMLVHHDGYYEHLSQSIAVLPDTKEFVVALCNRSDFRPAKLIRNILKQLSSLPMKKNSNESSVQLDKSSELTQGLYYDKNTQHSALIFKEDNEFFYYGNAVGSPQKLHQIAKSKWSSHLSAKTIYFKRISDNEIVVSDRQITTRLSLIIFPEREKKLPSSVLRYNNEFIGNIVLTLGNQSNINFINSFGEIPLQCASSNMCFSEDGYVIVDATKRKQILVSTRDFQNLIFIPTE